MMDDNTLRAAKTVVAIVLLAVVVLWTGSVVGRYRSATADGSKETTSTAQPSTESAPPSEKKAEQPEKATSESSDDKKADEKPATGPTVTVKVDGLNFREEPEKSAKVIRGLNAGERLILIERKDGWFYAEDASGEKGWLYGSEQYSSVEE